MSERLLDYTGKSVLITGAATGIGRATALAFARQGASVAIGDVDARAEDAVREIVQAGGQAFYQRTDVRQAADVAALVDATVARFGGLNCAFNNAGILPPTLPLAEMADDTFDDILAMRRFKVLDGAQQGVDRVSLLWRGRHGQHFVCAQIQALQFEGC